MYVSSKESLRKKVAAEEPLTRGELRVVGKLLDRLEKLEAVARVATKHVWWGVAANEIQDTQLGPHFWELKDTTDALAALEEMK